MEMKSVFQAGQRVTQRSTEKVGTIKSYDEHPTTGTRFYHVQFDGETSYTPLAESDLQAVSQR
jgi:hypothetical protein